MIKGPTKQAANGDEGTVGYQDVIPPNDEELRILAELIRYDTKLKAFTDIGFSRDAAKRRISSLCRRYGVGRVGLGYLAARYRWLDHDVSGAQL